MYCVKVRFEGYKRLAQTGCNTESPILAFVGSNESGKSTLLEGLEWLTNGAEDALLPIFANRTTKPSDVVVEARFELDDDDRAALDDLDLAHPPATALMQKHVDGSTRFGLYPEPARLEKPFQESLERLQSTHRRLAAQFEASSEGSESTDGTPQSWFDIVTDALEEPDQNWSAEVVAASTSLSTWLDAESPNSRSGKARDEKAAAALRHIAEIAQSPHPRIAARQRIRARVPRFVMFREADRVLSTTHPISDEGTRNSPQPALASLLRIARLDLNQLWSYVEQGDSSSRESYIEEANERLQDFFTEAWNQSKLTVRLKVTESTLEVLFKEMRRGGPVTNIEERSDGLRTFVALAAFLASQQLAVPPILLIDEAETHLHLDAQADLVGVLLKQVNATQVFYTTHSPGCLPTDLGTGIRLLRKDPGRDNASEIRADFWTNQEPGFAPLLYAMGASAAAFSVCRRAVLAEGAADMILLPTLIRKATGLNDLSYQIAPGLAAAQSFDMRVADVAGRVLYLTDGDGSGETYVKQLLEAGIPKDHVFSLPDGWASEDLVSRAYFVDVINALMGSDKLAESELVSGTPVVKALEEWGKSEGVSTPGHVAIAYGLVNAKEIELATGATEALQSLHGQWMKLFEKP